MADKPYSIRKSEKHGRWIKRTAYPMGYICPVCNSYEETKSPYCRWCGADMRGDNNGL